MYTVCSSIPCARFRFIFDRNSARYNGNITRTEISMITYRNLAHGIDEHTVKNTRDGKRRRRTCRVSRPEKKRISSELGGVARRQVTHRVRERSGNAKVGPTTSRKGQGPRERPRKFPSRESRSEYGPEGRSEADRTSGAAQRPGREPGLPAEEC